MPKLCQNINISMGLMHHNKDLQYWPQLKFSMLKIKGFTGSAISNLEPVFPDSAKYSGWFYKSLEINIIHQFYLGKE